MKTFFCLSIIGAFFLSGCAAFNAHHVGPTPIQHARYEISENQLLDVGIAVFSGKEPAEEEAKTDGTLPGIRKAENHFVPFHLKNTLQQSSQWGMVQVAPTDTDFADVMVRGTLLESNGEEMIVDITVADASGTPWFQKKYRLKPDDDAFEDIQIGRKDAFQDLYNTIANDMTAFKAELSPDRINVLRTIAKLKFAADMAPDAFGEYLRKNPDGRMTLNRLPADDDPMMARLLRIRERDHMFVDTLNEYYEKFYNDMWSAYRDWRELSRTERIARSKLQKDALFRQVTGALLVATAIFLEAKDVKNTGLLKGLLVVSGGKLFIDGVDISQQRKIHAAAIEELSESFDNEMKPIVLEFEGRQYALTGNAEEQYAKWRELLRKIYYEETGFAPTHSPLPDSSSIR